MLVVWVFFLVVLVVICSAEDSAPMRKIDEDVFYTAIHPFQDEWNRLVNESNLAPAPIQFWFRCIDKSVRGYLFIEHLHHLDHDKEAYMPSVGIINKKLFFFADGKQINMKTWLGGVDFSFQLPNDTPSSHWVDITIQGFKHFTRFPVSYCTKSKPESQSLDDVSKRKYLMHVHLNDHRNTKELNPLVIKGVANHLYYHFCTLALDNYEVVVHEDQVPMFLADAKIAAAAKQGKITFIIRNPSIPEPIHMSPHRKFDCYWQQYTENMAILRHWQENTRVYFMDSDEFITFNNTLTKNEYYKKINSGSAFGYPRYMTFHDKVQKKIFPEELKVAVPTEAGGHHGPHHGGQADVFDFSFTHKDYIYINHRLRDPKLVVDPNRVGCYIVHWAGCGDPTQELNPVNFGRILHFENLYRNRWPRQNIESMENSPLVPTKNSLKCDPLLMEPGSDLKYWD